MMGMKSSKSAHPRPPFLSSRGIRISSSSSPSTTTPVYYTSAVRRMKPKPPIQNNNNGLPSSQDAMYNNLGRPYAPLVFESTDVNGNVQAGIAAAWAKFCYQYPGDPRCYSMPTTPPIKTAYDAQKVLEQVQANMNNLMEPRIY